MKIVQLILSIVFTMLIKSNLKAQIVDTFNTKFVATEKITWLNVGTQAIIDVKKRRLLFNSRKNIADERKITQLPFLVSENGWYLEFSFKLKEITPHTRWIMLALSRTAQNPVQQNLNSIIFNDNSFIGVACLYDQVVQKPILYPIHKTKDENYKFTEEGIILPHLDSTYFVRIEKISQQDAMLAVFSDADFETHLSNSPQCFKVPIQLKELKFLQTTSFNQQNNDLPTAIIDSIRLIDTIYPRYGAALKLNTEYKVGDVIHLESKIKEEWGLYKVNNKGDLKGNPIKSKTDYSFTIDTEKDVLTLNRWYVLKKSISAGQITCKKGKSDAVSFFLRGQPYKYEKSKLYKDLKTVKTNNAIVLEDISFVRSESYLLEKSYGQLDTLATIMKEFPSMIIQVEGHTEPIGNASANLELSRERVVEVKKQLMRLGIDNSRIKAVGFGMQNPKYKNSPKNRRVEVRIVKW